MNHEKFNEILDNLFKKISNLSDKKASEYASDCDRLNNFKHYGKVFNCEPETALIRMCGKHIISVLDMLNDIENNKHSPLNLWDEKIFDIILYMILLKALLTERYEEKETLKYIPDERLNCKVTKYEIPRENEDESIIVSRTFTGDVDQNYFGNNDIGFLDEECTLCGEKLFKKDWPFLFRNMGKLCNGCKEKVAELQDKILTKDREKNND